MLGAMRGAVLSLLYVSASSSSSEFPGSCTDPGCLANVDSDDVNLVQTERRIQVPAQQVTNDENDDCVTTPKLSIKEVRAALKAVGGVTNTQAKTRITAASCAGLKASMVDAGIDTLDEFSMYLANVVQESDRLAATAEYDVSTKKDLYDWGENKDEDTICPVNGNKGCEGSGCESTCLYHYYGRGYIMTTSRENYKDASKSVCGTSDCLLSDPSQLEDPVGAWKSAGDYWKRTIKNVFGDGDYVMGQTILAINGYLECEVGWDGKTKTDTSAVSQLDHAKKRFCFYRKIYEHLLGTDAPADDEKCVLTTCAEDDCDDCA